MIDIRRLAADEYDLLKEIDDGFTPDPRSSIAMVAQAGGKLVGRIFLVAPSHAEGIWVREDHRGGELFKQMMQALEREAVTEGISKMFAYSVKPEIEHYISRKCGYKRLSWSVLSKELTCQVR